MICPVQATETILVQEAWKKEVKLDEPFDTNLQERALAWWDEIVSLPSLQQARWIGGWPEAHLIRVFSDGSASVDGCGTYLVPKAGQNLVFAEARVARLKRQTLARLELQAPLLGSNGLAAERAELRLKVVEIYS